MVSVGCVGVGGGGGGVRYGGRGGVGVLVWCSVRCSVSCWDRNTIRGNVYDVGRSSV